MKKLANVFALLAALSVPYLMAGCDESAAGSNDNGSGPGGSGGTGGGVDPAECKYKSDEGAPYLGEGPAVASAPEGLMGDFVEFNFENNVYCAGVSVCEWTAFDTDQVQFKSADSRYIFVAKTVSGDCNKVAEVTWSWDDTSDWALAPNGTYVDEDGDKEQLFVEYYGGEIKLNEGSSELGPIKGNKFGTTFEDGGSIRGDISEDLKTVSYTLTLPFGGEIEKFYTLVE